MSQALETALLTFGRHPLCDSVTIEKGEEDHLVFFVQNQETGDPAWDNDLEETLIDYDRTGKSYRLTIFLPAQVEPYEQDGWETPSAAERNASMFAFA